MVRLEKSRDGMHHLDGRPTAEMKSVMEEKLQSGFRPATARPEISVDYPRHEERVTSPDYTIRISAQGQSLVEVSIDDGAWRSCRRACGFWWYDWSDYRGGAHSVLARVTLQHARRALSARRHFVVG